MFRKVSHGKNERRPCGCGVIRRRSQNQLDQDLMRMKRMIETGIAAHDAARKEKAGAYILKRGD
jgi:hypothetical protein